MNTFLGELATFNDIQYARYRLAFKLRKLQKTFVFDEVDMSTLQEGLHLGGVEPLPRSAVISTSQLITAIQELYSSLRLHRPMLSSSQVQLAQELCSNWLQMNYQCATGGKIQVGSLKIILCLLTGIKEADKARYMFSILANSNGSVEATDIAYFCDITQQLARTLQEDVFANWEGHERFWRESLLRVRSADDIADEEFDGGEIKRQWLSLFEFIKVFSTQPSPHFLSWWDLFHQVKMLGKIVHSVRCSACTRKPMVSFRYQCTECSNFNLCQMCFLKGKLAGTHKDSHRMLEISMPSKSQKSWKNRLLGAGGQDGRIWDEPKSPFVFSPRSSVSSFGSSGDHTDTSMSALSDLLASSQQQKSAINCHAHKPTMIRIGSQPTTKNHVISMPKKPVTTPTHSQLQRSSLSTLSTSGSGSPDSISSSGGKFSYEGARASHSRTTSSSSCNDSLPSGVNSDLGKTVHLSVTTLPQGRMRSESMQHQPAKLVEDELEEINRRLSVEVDMLLSDITSSMEDSPPPVKPSISPIGGYSRQQLRHRRGYSLQHLRFEEIALEEDVSDLTNKREELKEELEGLISQVQSLHTRSVSLSNGLRVAPSISISPLVAPTHPRSDSLPAEAYTGHTSSGQSPMPSVSPIPGLSPVPSRTATGRGHSPLIHRKVSPTQQIGSMTVRSDTSSPVHYQGPSGLYSSQEQMSDEQPDPMSDYDHPTSRYQNQPHQLALDL